jgi:hypothetical protein
MTEIDPVQNERITALASALEEAAVTLMRKEPFDNSKILSAIGQFNGRQEQASALCSAVEQVSVLHHAADPRLPTLSIDGEKSGTNWAAYRVSAQFKSDSDSVLQEPIFTLPLQAQDQAAKVVCNLYTLPGQQANIHPGDPASNSMKPPEHQ